MSVLTDGVDDHRQLRLVVGSGRRTRSCTNRQAVVDEPCALEFSLSLNSSGYSSSSACSEALIKTQERLLQSQRGCQEQVSISNDSSQLEEELNPLNDGRRTQLTEWVPPVPSNLFRPPSRSSYYKCFSNYSSEFTTDAASSEDANIEICSSCCVGSTLRENTQEQQTRQEPAELIDKLKHHSDPWTGPRVIKRSESVTVRLHEGVRRAHQKQEQIEDLLAEAAAQKQSQIQAFTALQVCEDEGSLERAEAERIILLAGQRFKAFHTEAEKLVLSGDHQEGTEATSSSFTATLFLNDITLEFASDFYNNVSKSSVHHFLCLLRELKTQGITATHSATLADLHPHSSLKFSNHFTLPDIPSDFEMMLEIYQMVDNPQSKCRRRLPKVLQSCTNNELNYNVPPINSEGALSSRFTLVGRIVIDKSTLNNREFNVENLSAPGVTVVEKVSITASTDYEHNLSSHHFEGYLSVCKNQWSRRWFTLRGASLSCWLYPDQPAERTESPESKWNLALCTEPLQPASPTLTAWQHAFVLPITTEENNRLLLAADSHRQKMVWLEAMNSVVAYVSAWR